MNEAIETPNAPSFLNELTIQPLTNLALGGDPPLSALEIQVFKSKNMEFGNPEVLAHVRTLQSNDGRFIR